MGDEHHGDSFLRTIGGILVSALCVLIVCVLLFGFLTRRFLENAETQRKNTLMQMVTLGHNAITPILRDVRDGRLDPSQARDEARALVRRMTYSDQFGENYLFMSAYDGTMLVQPFEPEKEMTNQWGLQDSNGVFIIQRLIDMAQSPERCGFVRYDYLPPGKSDPEEKLAYVIGIPELQCYIGTGMYMQQPMKNQQQLLLLARTFSLLMILFLLAPVLMALRQLSRHNLRLAQQIHSRQQAESALRESEERYRTIFEASRDALFVYDGQVFVDCNSTALHIFAAPSREALFARSAAALSPLEQPGGISSEDLAATHITAALNGQPQCFEWVHLRFDGTPFFTEIALNRTEIGRKHYILATVRDITERKQAEKERERLQERLLQAQKLEAVGQLAGGVAHDFNNMLQAILGFVGLALDTLPDNHPALEYLEEVKTAADRSATLTRQLLAFARKQTAAPAVLDINTAVENMLAMLRRLIGEQIDLIWQPQPDPWPVKIDPAQLNQILANLCVNARDAIAGIGAIVIETAKTTVTPQDPREDAECCPGDYMRLSVRDNGHGIAEADLKHIFEPFYTTKGLGKGTGLGLATVYGVTHQNHGFVRVQSTPSQGAVFHIHLPRYHGPGESTPIPESHIPQGQGETVLLVEDEPAILRMAQTLLERLGYRCLVASSPIEALTLAQDHAQQLRLLITDVIMPEMNGRDLAERLRGRHPGLRCLFMSGYTAEIIAPHGVLESGVHFIQKPFSKNDLATKIRDALA